MIRNNFKRKNIMKKTTFLLLILSIMSLVPVFAADTVALPVFTRSEPVRERTPVTIANPGFEQAGGWFTADGGPFKPSPNAHSGKQSCRVDSFTKGGLIELKAGEELQFEAYTKVDDLRTINVELAYFNAKRQWLRRGSPSLARGDQYSWQKISGRHEITDPEVRFVTLQFDGAGEVDDVSVWKLAAMKDTGDQAKAMNNIELPRENSNQYVYLKNDSFELWISRKSGMMTKLVILSPEPKVIQPAGTNSMQLYLKSQAPGVDGDFNRAVTMETGPGQVTVRVVSDNPAVASLAEAEVIYQLEDNRLVTKSVVKYLKDSPEAFQLGLRNVFRAHDWQRNIFMSFPIQAKPPATVVRAAFLYGVHDNSVKNMNVRYPGAVLEGNDRYLLWGSYDLGKFAMLTPNDIPGRLPSQQVNPTGVKAGETQVFESIYTVFPKADHELTQVMRHYVRNFYSSNPLTADILKWQPKEDRYFTEGAFAWYHPGAVPTGYDGWRQAMRERRANNVWYSWWTNWDEVCPTEGNWFTYDGRKLSADGIKAEIQYMKKQDLNVYLYFRQFLVEDGVHDDRPPYRRWLGRDSEGKRIPFIDYPFPHPEWLNGLTNIRWTMADFGAADYREWYLDMVKRSIDFYQPSGVAWDMGFGGAYSAASPETGIGHGTLWVQAMIYRWLKEKYPQMRVASNESIANPTALFADSILIEGAWHVCGKSELDYQVARAYDATLFSLQLTDDYIIQGAPPVDLTPYRYALVRARGERLAKANAGLGELIQHGFKADGTWQWVTVPLTRKNFRMLSVSIIAADTGNGYLEISDLALADQNKEKKLTIWDNKTLADDFVRFAKWSHNLPSAGAVSQTENGIRFTADQPRGESGSWLCITPVKDKWLRTNLKVTALGAICSDAQIPALKELNEFSARLAAMRHLSDYKVIYDAPRGIYGTFWARGSEVAGAIYNESGTTRQIALRINRKALPGNGDTLQATATRIRLVNEQGRIGAAHDFELKPQADYILLTGTLPSGQLLLLDNFASESVK